MLAGGTREIGIARPLMGPLMGRAFFGGGGSPSAAPIFQGDDLDPGRGLLGFPLVFGTIIWTLIIFGGGYL